MPSAYSSFRDKLLKYEYAKPDPNKTIAYSNRLMPFHSKDRKHILKNIRNVKNISALNQLRTLSASETKHRDASSNNKANFVFFKRKDKSKNNRFNENNYGNPATKRPQTKHLNTLERLNDLGNDVRVKERLSNISTRSVDLPNDNESICGSVKQSIGPSSRRSNCHSVSHKTKSINYSGYKDSNQREYTTFEEVKQAHKDGN